MLFFVSPQGIAGFGEGTPQQDSRRGKMSEKRILAPRQNLALRNCRTAVHFLLPLFQKIATSFFHKRRRAGILPLTPYKPQKSRMDGLSGKNFSGGSVFPDNKAFWKLCFARCMKKWQPFLASLSNMEHLEICQKWAQKKQQIFFGFTASCAATGRRLFSCK